LFNDILQAIAVTSQKGYQRLWVLTNNYPKTINMTRAKIDFNAVRLLGITEIKIEHWTQDLEIDMNLKAEIDFAIKGIQTQIIVSYSHGPTLLYF
jgi:hypothetical protein